MQDALVGAGERYRALECIAADSLGTLWHGASERTGATVCIRFLPSRLTADAGRVRRATAELRSLHWHLSDPHVARVLDHDLRSTSGRGGFVVFDVAENRLPTRTLAQAPPSSMRRLLEVVAAVAGGLAAAHAARVFHRSLTATSVVLDELSVAKVVDLGLGELLAVPDHRRSGGSTTLVGQGAVDVLAIAGLFEALRPHVADDGADASRIPADVFAVLDAAGSSYPLLRPHPSRIVEAIASALGPDAAEPLVELPPVPVVEPATVPQPEPVPETAGIEPEPESQAEAPAAEEPEPEPEPAPEVPRPEPEEPQPEPESPSDPEPELAELEPEPELVELEPEPELVELEPEPELEELAPVAAVEPEWPHGSVVAPDVETVVGTAQPRARYRARHRARGHRTLLVAILSALVLAGAGLGGAALIGADGDGRPDRSGPPDGTVAPPTTSPGGSVTPSAVVVVRATVPDVVGLRVGPASSVLREAGLALGSVTTVPGPAGVVVRTDPTPGEAVLAESVVDVFVGNGVNQ